MAHEPDISGSRGSFASDATAHLPGNPPPRKPSAGDTAEPAILATRILSSGPSPTAVQEKTRPDGPQPAPEGMRQFGDYDLLEEIARGGMGVVFKARQRSLNRIVALKMILEGQLASERSVQRFRQEAQAAAALDHPNIVPIHEIGQQDGHHFFTMAFIEGCSLKVLIKERGLPTPGETVSLLLAIAEAVDFANRQGIIHRDLKPDNVLIDPQGRPRVTDFGLAKRMEGDAGLTASGAVLGTPAFMAPEQALGGKRQLGPEADVYALGGILYFLLTGRPPFGGETVTEVLCQVVKELPVPPRQGNPEIPADLEAICLKCLEKEPAQRFPTAGALADALRASNSFEASLSGSRWNSGVRPPYAADSGRGDLGTGLKNTRPDSLAWSSSGPGLPAKKAAGPVRVLPWLLLGLAGVAVLAVGTWFGLLRWVAKPPGEQIQAQNPPEAQAGVPAGAHSGVPVNKLLPGDPIQPMALPEPSQHDFGLRVTIVGAMPGEDGVWQLVDGQKVEYSIEVDRDAYVGVWDFQADGTVVQLFPNKYDPNHLVKKGQRRLVPGSEAEITANLSKGGPEQLRILATSERWDPVQGENEGPFSLYKTVQEKERLRRQIIQTREMVLKPVVKGDKKLAEEAIKYQVLPRK